MSSSPSLTELVNALKCLPGVGQKSAQRMALYLIERDQTGAKRIADATIAALETQWAGSQAAGGNRPARPQQLPMRTILSRATPG